MRTATLRGLALSATIALALAAPTSGQSGRREWRFYGGDRGGMRYSPLAEITRANVGRLERVWTYHTGELALGLAESRLPADPEGARALVSEARASLGVAPASCGSSARGSTPRS